MTQRAFDSAFDDYLTELKPTADSAALMTKLRIDLINRANLNSFFNRADHTMLGFISMWRDLIDRVVDNGIAYDYVHNLPIVGVKLTKHLICGFKTLAEVRTEMEARKCLEVIESPTNYYDEALKAIKASFLSRNQIIQLAIA